MLLVLFKSLLHLFPKHLETISASQTLMGTHESLRILLKCRFFDSADLVGPRVAISNKLPGDTNAAGLKTLGLGTSSNKELNCQNRQAK